MKTSFRVLLSLIMMMSILLSACGKPTEVPTEAPVVTEEPAGPTEEPSEPEPLVDEALTQDLGLPGELAGMSWLDIVEEARGQTINFWHWGGSEQINTWFDQFWGNELLNRYQITLNRVPVTDAPQFVNQVLGEKEAGKDTDGSVDILWINGENFITMFESGLLYGPYADVLPNGQYYNIDALRWDWGYDNQFFESPLGVGQNFLVYDSAKVPNPPSNFEEFEQWIKDNPGKFTYPQPPMFDGTRFIKEILYYTTGGYRQWLGDYNEELWTEKSPLLWQWMVDIKPFLWREGETYPATRADYDQLFGDGEIWFNYTTGFSIKPKVDAGIWPESARPLLLAPGHIGGSNYLAIPYNSPHKAAAMVMANLAMDPEMQLFMADPQYGWSAGPAINVSALDDAMRALWEALTVDEYTLGMAQKAERRLPEMLGKYNSMIEEEWRKYILEGVPIPGE